MKLDEHHIWKGYNLSINCALELHYNNSSMLQ